MFSCKKFSNLCEEMGFFVFLSSLWVLCFAVCLYFWMWFRPFLVGYHAAFHPLTTAVFIMKVKLLGKLCLGGIFSLALTFPRLFVFQFTPWNLFSESVLYTGWVIHWRAHVTIWSVLTWTRCHSSLPSLVCPGVEYFLCLSEFYLLS